MIYDGRNLYSLPTIDEEKFKKYFGGRTWLLYYKMLVIAFKSLQDGLDHPGALNLRAVREFFFYFPPFMTTTTRSKSRPKKRCLTGWSN